MYLGGKAIDPTGSFGQASQTKISWMSHVLLKKCLFCVCKQCYFSWVSHNFFILQLFFIASYYNIRLIILTICNSWNFQLERHQTTKRGNNDFFFKDYSFIYLFHVLKLITCLSSSYWMLYALTTLSVTLEVTYGKWQMNEKRFHMDCCLRARVTLTCYRCGDGWRTFPFLWSLMFEAFYFPSLFKKRWCISSWQLLKLALAQRELFTLLSLA